MQLDFDLRRYWIMKIMLSLLLFLISVGCTTLEEPKNKTHNDKNKMNAEIQLIKSISVNRFKLTPEDFNKFMGNAGFAVLGKQNHKVEMRNDRDEVMYVLKNIYYNNDYVYVDLAFESTCLKEQGDMIEIQYDREAVYSIARINSENLSHVRNAIGYSSYQITDSTKDGWVGFLFKKRVEDLDIEIPLTINLNQEYSAYIILTLPAQASLV
ncbi:hypothetical protein [Desulfallas thermosapovorans]|nr:hypothetical protein [Desulfallas thermosapovorans]